MQVWQVIASCECFVCVNICNLQNFFNFLDSHGQYRENIRYLLSKTLQKVLNVFIEDLQNLTGISPHSLFFYCFFFSFFFWYLSLYVVKCIGVVFIRSNYAFLQVTASAVILKIKHETTCSKIPFWRCFTLKILIKDFSCV